jgi:hypothetical protein
MDFLFLWENICKNIFFVIFWNSQGFQNHHHFHGKNLKNLQLFSKKVISSNISRKDMSISLKSAIEFLHKSIFFTSTFLTLAFCQKITKMYYFSANKRKILSSAESTNRPPPPPTVHSVVSQVVVYWSYSAIDGVSKREVALSPAPKNEVVFLGIHV